VVERGAGHCSCSCAKESGMRRVIIKEVRKSERAESEDDERGRSED